MEVAYLNKVQVILSGVSKEILGFAAVGLLTAMNKFPVFMPTTHILSRLL
jgi:hypothetical protein